MLRDSQLSALAWVERELRESEVQAFMLSWALAPQILPEQEAIGQSFYIMIPGIHVYGQAIPRGGSQALPLAMARYVEAKGGSRADRHAVSQVHRRGTATRAACSWPTAREIRAKRAVVVSASTRTRRSAALLR